MKKYIFSVLMAAMAMDNKIGEDNECNGRSGKSFFFKTLSLLMKTVKLSGRNPKLMDFLLKYVAQEKVERIVVGHPKQMNNEDSENMKYIKPFVAQLKKKLPDMPVELVDERFTSVLAHQAMLDGGKSFVHLVLIQIILKG